MPRDIRSYFTSVATAQKKNESTSKPQKKRVISSDEEGEDQEKLKSSTKRTKIVSKPKKVSPLSDSDDDVTFIKKETKKFKVNNSIEKEKSYTPVSPGELFGKKPVTRVEETVIKRKLQKKESEFHNDDDFDAVLKQLDTHDFSAQRNKKKKVNHNESKQSECDNLSEDLCDESKKDKTENEIMKRSPSKHNNARSKNTSPSKRKSHKKDNIGSSSNNDSSISNSHNDNVSKELNLKSVTNRLECASTSDVKEQSPKKAKTLDLFEERVEKKKQRAFMYEKYLQRGGARNPGSKEIPTGAKNCLAGIKFLITGVLDSLEREEAADLIREYGGHILSTVSSKVNYIIVGDEAGPTKLLKASSLGIKQISEDDLLEMIRTRPEGKSECIKPATTKSKSKARNTLDKSANYELSSPRKMKTSNSSMKAKTPSPIKAEILSPKQISTINSTSQETTMNIGTQPLVEKYRPKIMKQIIGQHGDKSCANNLYIWLRDWHKNRQDPKFKDGTGKQTHGQTFKAALLSGPPGVGKTTTVQVVCKELGYDLLEFNASDTRNKTLLKEEVSGLLSNTTMKNYFTGTQGKITNKHVLLMDEVDGMAGNEDRGGLQELVNLMKHTDIPIICICNDRFNTRVKTISCHSYDLRFPKLRVEQIRSSMLSLCYKENIKISKEDLDRLIESTNHDMRQVINHLEFLSCKTVHVQNTDKKHSNKDVKLGPFDVTKMIFNIEQKNMSLNDKIGLYFHDYNITPLFVQENYIGVRLSQVSPLQRLKKIAEAANSISQGDLIEKVMRSNMIWSLLPLHACFSFVIPGNAMSGNLDSLVRFPSWFGRNSKAMRFNRLTQDLTSHTRLATGASKDALNLDYLVHIRNAIIKPLINNGTVGIEEALNVMGQYHLTREDLDSMIEISTWRGISDPINNLDSKVKAAFTRAYQKNPPILPYAVNNSGTAKKRVTQNEDYIEEEDDDDDEEADDINFDKMIKAKKPTTSKTSATSRKDNEQTKSEKGRGRGRGRGRAKTK